MKFFPGPANKGNEEWEIDYIKQNCKILGTGEYYIDYFTNYDNLVGGGEGSSSIHYSKLRDIIVDGLNDPELSANSNTYNKLCWAADQFNLTARQFNLGII